MGKDIPSGLCWSILQDEIVTVLCNLIYLVLESRVVMETNHVEKVGEYLFCHQSSLPRGIVYDLYQRIVHVIERSRVCLFQLG